MQHRKSWVDLCQQQAPVKETGWWSHDCMQNSYTESDIGLVSTQLNCLVNFRFVYLMSWVSKKLGLYIRFWLLSVRAAVFQSYYCVLQFGTGKIHPYPSVTVPLFLCFWPSVPCLFLCPSDPVLLSPSLFLSYCPSVPLSLCPSVPQSIFYCV